MSDRVGAVTMVTAAALLAVVGGVGAVSLFAEWRGVWSSYFLMERTIEVSAPLATVLMGLAVVTWSLAVYAAS